MGFLQRIKDALDPDRALQEVMNGFIEAVGGASARSIASQSVWTPGKPLKLFFAGYVGTRNTGADVRVEEMIRQIRGSLGDDNLELTIMTVDPALTAGYFRTVRQVELPVVFPKFLFDECPKHHGVIACEGSMFKSKFANALSIDDGRRARHRERRGQAQRRLRRRGRRHGRRRCATSCSKHCKQSLVICRNEPSRDVLGALGIRTTGGADTAWTFEPAPPSAGAELLRERGWDGKTPVLVVCPINPFWWPVKPDLREGGGEEAGRSVPRRALPVGLLPPLRRPRRPRSTRRISMRSRPA